MDSKDFLAALAQDPALEDKFHQCDSPESVLALAKSMGFTGSLQDLQTSLNQASSKATQELSDDAVADLSGGSHGDRSGGNLFTSKPAFAARLAQLRESNFWG
jgi:predicted ribosomally synthesized peptide with nif11-like leader